MAHRDATRGARRVPITFDDYLVTRGAKEVEPQTCASCRPEGGRWSLGDSVDCEPCLKYMHGYDQAEEVMVRRIVGAAVAAALDAGASLEFVRAAVDDALDDSIRTVAYSATGDEY